MLRNNNYALIRLPHPLEYKIDVTQALGSDQLIVRWGGIL